MFLGRDMPRARNAALNVGSSHHHPDSMITVTIGGMSVPANSAGEGWVNQMISEAKKRRESVCVQVSVNEPGVQLMLATPACGSSGGGGRLANDRERRIIDAWAHRRLNESSFNPGDVRAFINDLARLI